MRIYNAKIGDTLHALTLENGSITAIDENTVGGDLDAGGRRVIPGLIDIHTHGGKGMDTMDADLEPLCRYHAENGTTSFLPTTMTMDYPSLLRVTEAETDFEGAQILGFHFEGPYVSEKYKGAQNPAFIRNPSAEEFKQFKNVKMVTIAPERPGSMDFIKAVTPDCVVALGHTDCDYETACKAMDAGANCLTHTFNAMPPFLHRAPGPIGAAVEKGIYAQVIGDGFHVQKPMLIAAYRFFGPARMVLISDSIRSAKLPDGMYDSGGLTVYLKDGIARLEDGTVAGSGSCLLDCIKVCVDCGIPFEDAVRMATQTPAELLGVNKGRIEVGYDADLLLLNDDLSLHTVIIGGKIYK